MSQFASTLYPQTNPSNQALLAFRELHETTGNDLWSDAYLFTSGLMEEGVYKKYGEVNWHHAMDVLEKILAVYNPRKRTG